MSPVKLAIILNNLLSRFGSFLMITILRMGGANIGRNTYISFSSRIVANNNLVIGNDCVIKSRVKIKANIVSIGHNCIISENSYITGDSDFTLGNKSFIGKKVRINVSRNVTIGEDVGIGENSVIWTHGYFPPADEGYPVTYSPVNIEDGAWVSTNIIILPGVNIGKGVIIGAGSVVTKDVEADSLVAGNPAKFIKKTSEFRSQKSFIEIMDKIFSRYPEFTLIEKDESLLKYAFHSKKMYVVDGSKISEKSLIPENSSILIFKYFTDTILYKTNSYLWFDLSSRTMTSKRSKEVQHLVNILRSYGIRLLKSY